MSNYVVDLKELATFISSRQRDRFGIHWSPAEVETLLTAELGLKPTPPAGKVERVNVARLIEELRDCGTALDADAPEPIFAEMIYHCIEASRPQRPRLKNSEGEEPFQGRWIGVWRGEGDDYFDAPEAMFPEASMAETYINDINGRENAEDHQNFHTMRVDVWASAWNNYQDDEAPEPDQDGWLTHGRECFNFVPDEIVSTQENIISTFNRQIERKGTDAALPVLFALKKALEGARPLMVGVGEGAIHPVEFLLGSLQGVLVRYSEPAPMQSTCSGMVVDMVRMIGTLDRCLSEMLHVANNPGGYDPADLQTLKHHLEDTVGAASKALKLINPSREETPESPANS